MGGFIPEGQMDIEVNTRGCYLFTLYNIVPDQLALSGVGPRGQPAPPLKIKSLKVMSLDRL